MLVKILFTSEIWRLKILKKTNACSNSVNLFQIMKVWITPGVPDKAI